MTDDELLRFQEGGAGRFMESFSKQFPYSDMTIEQLAWIEKYYKNVSDKELW